jgi:hypothetical protein
METAIGRPLIPGLEDWSHYVTRDLILSVLAKHITSAFNKNSREFSVDALQRVVVGYAETIINFELGLLNDDGLITMADGFVGLTQLGWEEAHRWRKNDE